MIVAKIVNKSLDGEQEHAVLQVIDTLKIFEFSQIKQSTDGPIVVTEQLIDGDLSSPTIQRILNNGHSVNISIDENELVTLHF